MTIASGFADISLLQLLLVAGVALFAILLSLLMAAGLEGAAVIATDSVISVITSIVKISVFGLAGVVTAQVLAFAILIGAMGVPAAFLARALVERMPVHIHAAILDAAVIAGGLMMISAAARQLF